MNVILLGIVFLYEILSQKFLQNFTPYYSSLINPLFWIIISVFSLFMMQRKYIDKENENKIMQYSFIAGLFYIIIYLLSGLVVSFGKNPYVSTFKGIMTNIWVTAIPIICREIVRWREFKQC